MRVALLEDDPAQTELIQSWMSEAGHSCHAYGTGKAYREALSDETFDTLIVDWNLPDCTGIEIVQWVRANVDWHIPVLFITSRDHEEDVVTALEAGADDYMTKPVKQRETIARVAALERRAVTANEADEQREYPPFVIDMAQRQILADRKPVDLTNKEFDLAVVLFANVGRLLSRSYLLEKVWGTKAELTTRTVDTHASRVRIKLGIRPESGWRLNAVYHHGYRLEHISGDN